MASFGNNLLRNSSMDQTQVYKRQEKEFNIINFHPKEYKPNLRQFPKLTVEDKLNEGIKQRKNDWLVRFYDSYISCFDISS